MQVSSLIVQDSSLRPRYTANKHEVQHTNSRISFQVDYQFSLGALWSDSAPLITLIAAANQDKTEVVMCADVATLLLFEQDRATRQLYARELGRHWQVMAVENAVGCTDVLTEQVVQAVVFGLGAANDDEWALLTKIVQLAAAAKAPVIVCSAIDARSRGYALGVSAYLIKPVLPQQLIGEVARWLTDRANRKEPTRGDYVGTNPSS